MANENLAVAGRRTQFSSTNQPANKGRKKKTLTVIKELGYSKDDLKAVFGNLIWYSEADLIEVAEAEANPIILRIVARQILAALDKCDLAEIKELLEYTLGKPTQQIDANVNKTGGDNFVVVVGGCDTKLANSEAEIDESGIDELAREILGETT